MSNRISGNDFIPEVNNANFRTVTYKTGNTTIKCDTIYCPNCSSNREKDTRQGGYREKWNTAEEDYKLTLDYREDETGFYAACSKCNHDLRNHEPKHDSYISVLIDENKQSAPLPTKMINDVVYQQGFYIIPYKEYERIREIGTASGGQILPTVEIDNCRFVVSWDDYLTKMRSIPNISVVGIPRTYWKSI
jgi:hypothetical protein